MRRINSIMHDGRAEVFLIGAPKCCTSSLWHVLKSHPGICFSKNKEPAYFSKNSFYKKGYDWYHSSYENMNKICMEASTEYSEAWQKRNEISAKRIYNYNPEAKIIYSVRDPLKRAVSEWRQLRYLIDGGNKSIKKNYGIEKTTNLYDDLKHYPGILDTSNYWLCVQPYRKYFGDKKIFVLFAEDIVENYNRNLIQIAQFMAVDPEGFTVKKFPHINIGCLKGEAKPLGKFMRGLPGYYWVGSRVGDNIKKFTNPLLKHNPDLGVNINEELYGYVEIRLRTDIERFLHWQGKSHDYYKWRM